MKRKEKKQRVQPSGKYPLDQSPLFKLTTKRRLADVLNLTLSELKTLIKERRYTRSVIVNEKGKARQIENPIRPLKLVQRRIGRLLGRIEPGPQLQCPVKGRSYVSNAAAHTSGKVIRTLDVKKFFPSTTSRRVYWFWHKVMHCSEDVAGILTALSTCDGHLPTGSPLSPILAYYAYFDAWNKMTDYVVSQECKISIYIDDITVSGERVPGELFWDLKKTIRGVGLDYHKEKNYWNGKGEITGVIVGSSGLTLPNRQHQKLHLARLEVRRAKTKKALQVAQTRLRGLLQQQQQILLHKN
jgi:Reverse transcriptase (RNA-dependent DNA polymerase)